MMILLAEMKQNEESGKGRGPKKKRKKKQ